MSTIQILPRARVGVVVREMGEGAVLYHPETETYYSLNEVAALLWSLLPPVSTTVLEVVDAICARYPDVSREIVDGDVRGLLDSLRQARLITDEPHR